MIACIVSLSVGEGITVIGQPLNSIIAHDNCCPLSTIATKRLRVNLDHGYVHSAFGCDQFHPFR